MFRACEVKDQTYKKTRTLHFSDWNLPEYGLKISRDQSGLNFFNRRALWVILCQGSLTQTSPCWGVALMTKSIPKPTLDLRSPAPRTEYTTPLRPQNFVHTKIHPKSSPQTKLRNIYENPCFSCMYIYFLWVLGEDSGCIWGWGAGDHNFATTFGPFSPLNVEECSFDPLLCLDCLAILAVRACDPWKYVASRKGT